MNRKVIITVALTGAGDTVGKSEHVPVSPQQIAESGIEAARAGAAVVHVRDPRTPTGRPGRGTGRPPCRGWCGARSPSAACRCRGSPSPCCSAATSGSASRTTSTSGGNTVTNARLVANAVTIITAMGAEVEVATRDEAREILALRPRG